MKVGYYKSPVGLLKIKCEEEYIIEVSFAQEELEENLNEAIIQCKRELEEYFNGDRKIFDVKLKYTLGTEFQQKVWDALKDIPYGEVVSYKYIANKIGNEKAVRAVGGANNKNPIAIIVPCHRVVGSNGKLVGYAGGLDVKEHLLMLEEKFKE